MREFVEGRESNSEDDDEERISLITSKVKHLVGKDYRALVRAVQNKEAIALDIHDLEPAKVSVLHSFELTDDTPNHSRARWMPLKRNTVVKKEVKELL